MVFPILKYKRLMYYYKNLNELSGNGRLAKKKKPYTFQLLYIFVLLVVFSFNSICLYFEKI